MAHNRSHREAVELLLQAITESSGDDGQLASFSFGEPGAPLWERRFGVCIFYSRKRLVRASLFVRRIGPPYLRYLAVDTIRSMLQDFISENFGYLAHDVFLRTIEGTYDRHVSENAKNALADALAASSIFKPQDKLTLFPLATVKISSEFHSEAFFLTTPDSLCRSHLLGPVDVDQLTPTQFPPLRDWKGEIWSPSAWLGVRSPVVRAAERMRAAVLGGVALTPRHRYRHQFNIRKLEGGQATLGDNGITISFGEPHTPPLMNHITITESDHPWLARLSAKIIKGDRASRRQLHALEYFYRAWFLELSERFPVLCMTLDAALGKDRTETVIDGVRSTIGSHVSHARLSLLMDLRAAVIHGGAPDVYDSRKYARYYDSYGEDPIHDMDLLVAQILRASVFGEAIKEHPDPNAAIIAEAQATGRLPRNLTGRTILDADGER